MYLSKPSTWKQSQEDACEFEAKLVYNMSSRLARIPDGDLVSTTLTGLETAQ